MDNRVRWSILGIVVLSVFLVVFPTFAADTVYLDFSDYPGGSADSAAIIDWKSSGTDQNPYYEHSLRLLYPSSTLQARFFLDTDPNSAQLIVTHLSSQCEACRGNGYSPMTITINGKVVFSNYDVAQHHDGSHDYQTDRWQIARYLQQGINTVKWRAENLCSHYWIKNFKITTTDRSRFLGEWVNINSDTDGITRLIISSSYQGTKIRAFGQCHPHDCDWGTTELRLVVENQYSNHPTFAIARWDKDFAEKALILHLTDNALTVEQYTVFTDDSGRSNYRNVSKFRRRW